MAIVFPSGTQTGPTKVLQVIQAQYTAAAVQSSGSNDVWYDLSGLSANITPSNSSNKILIMAHVSGYVNWDSGIRIQRDSTQVGIGDISASRTRCTVEYPQSNRSNEQGVHSFQWLDTANTTSQINYKLQFNWRGNSVYLNRSPVDDNNTNDHRAVSTLTLMEIAA